MFVSRRERKHIEWAFRPKPQTPTDADLAALEKRKNELAKMNDQIDSMEESLPKIRNLRESLCRSR